MGGFITTKASTITPERQRWLWDGRMPMDTPSIFAGRGGEGKTTFALDLAAQLTRGKLPGELYGKPSDVLIWAHEDKASTVLVPRLIAAQAELERVHIIKGITRENEDASDTPTFPQDAQGLRDAIRETGAALVILDPWTSTIPGDLNKAADVRKALDALASVCHDTGAVSLGIMHFNKGSGAAGNKLSGSHAFRDAVRSLFLFATDEETGNRVMTQEKNNYARNQATSLAFDLVSIGVPLADGDTTEVAKVEHLGESLVSVQDLIDRTNEHPEDKATRNAAQTFIYEFLKNMDEMEASAGDVIRAGNDAGFTDDQIKKARGRMRNPKVETLKEYGGGWLWKLKCSDDAEGAKGAKGAAA